MAYHPIVQEIIDLLRAHDCWFETFEHTPVRTSEQAALTRPGYSLKEGAKAMLVKIYTAKNDGRFVMLVFPADKKFDSKKVLAAAGAKNLRFATEEEVLQLTGGVQVGGVPPFGNLFELEIFCDPSLFNGEKMVFNAGDRGYSIAMKSEDYKKLTKPKIVNILQLCSR